MTETDTNGVWDYFRSQVGLLRDLVTVINFVRQILGMLNESMRSSFRHELSSVLHAEFIQLAGGPSIMPQKAKSPLSTQARALWPMFQEMAVENTMNAYTSERN